MADAKTTARFGLAIWFSLAGHYLSAQTDDYHLGDAPRAPTQVEAAEMLQVVPVPFDAMGGFTVDTSVREEIRLFHNAVYLASEGIAMDWTGDAATCLPGTTAQPHKDSVARRINYFRALAGVPAVIGFSPVNNNKDQQAALMMSVNDALSHDPPTTWTCYTAEGAEAAGKSNLAIGRAGASAVTAYIEDFGDNNAAVGHRRFILYPQTQTMGAGDVPREGSRRSANAVWAYDSNYYGPRPATRTYYVAWPPAGYVPYQVMCPRWSFSYPNASFTDTTISVTRNGQTLSVTKEPVSSGSGENTVVWYQSDLNPSLPYSWPQPDADTTYEVTLQNVVVGSTPSNFSYHVVVFDPSVPGDDSVLPTITGPTQLNVGYLSTLGFDPVPWGTSHQFRVSRRSPFIFVEGAEDGADRFNVSISSGYDVIVTQPVASGSHAFHLAHPILTPQYLSYLPVFVPSQTTSVEFHSRLGWASTSQVARVQVLVGGAGVWQDIYAQPGSGGAGEPSFTLRSISLTAFAGRSIQIRFVYDGTSGSYYPGSDIGLGWYLDDITITEAEELHDSQLSAPFTGNTFAWSPASEGDYAFEVRAQVFVDYLAEWGPAHSVYVSAEPPIWVPPVISAQPEDQAVPQGDTAEFTVLATGSEPLTYQWRFGEQPLTDQTNATLTLTSVTAAQAGIYTVQISNPASQITSDPAQLTVWVHPTISAQPEDQAVPEGSTAEFTVLATGSEPFAYQWWFGAQSLADQTNATLTLTSVTAAQAGLYTVQISNPASQTTSNPAQLTVWLPPAISAQPEDQAVPEGGTAEFTVLATGSEPLTYQWWFGAQPLTDQTNATLTLTAVTAAQAGLYTVQISNPASQITSNPARLKVEPPAPPQFERLELEDGKVTIHWSGTAILQEASNAAGPWTDLQTGPSPFSIIADKGAALYRLKSN
ncbi:MAG: immunoglobulin domain-containing protein [Verrucomicrobia bacterium]|nr:immunoglobulin domain-containing protein [Verrucomicrobiota bacterium]